MLCDAACAYIEAIDTMLKKGKPPSPHFRQAFSTLGMAVR